MDSNNQPGIDVAPKDALRPFLRTGEEVLWCEWAVTPPLSVAFLRSLAVVLFLILPALTGLLLCEYYRYVTVGEFYFPWGFIILSIIVAPVLAAAITHLERKGDFPYVMALTNRRCVTFSFLDIPVDPDRQEPFDLEEIQFALKWLNYDEIEEISIFRPTGAIHFWGRKRPQATRITFFNIKQPSKILALLPERVQAKLDSSTRKALLNPNAAGKIS